MPSPQEDEISEAAWVPFEEFKSYVQAEGETPHPVMQLVCKIIEQGDDADVQRSMIASVVPGRKKSPVYHVPLKTANKQKKRK